MKGAGWTIMSPVFGFQLPDPEVQDQDFLIQGQDIQLKGCVCT